MKKNAIFIVGIGKTGSKMYSQLLNNSKEVFIAPEINFWFPFKRCLVKEIKRFNNLKSENDVNQFVNALFNNEFIHSNKYWESINKIEFEHKLNNCDKSLKSIFSIFISEISKYNDFKINRIGAKFPVHFKHTAKLLNWFPDAQILFISRDPRAILASELNMKAAKTPSNQFPAKNKGLFFRLLVAAYVIIQWNWSLLLGIRLRKRFKSNLLLVKYEDMVANPAGKAKEIYSFLNLTFSENILNVDVLGSRFNGQQEKGFNKENMERWRENLPRYLTIIVSIFTLRRLYKKM